MFKRAARRDSRIWVVVADRAKARIFSAEWEGLTGFRELETLVHPQGAMHARDVEADTHGRNRAPDGHRYTTEPAGDFRHRTADAFANRIVERIDQGRQAGEFGRLVIAAPPLMLGRLRMELSTVLKDLLVADFDQELTGLGEKEILARVRSRLEAVAEV
ncbi:MAG: host attachment protein [Planctomyces sp.]|nr:host attachment protein [Planctomyces sp.]